jgi:hypothetical protein
VHSIFPVLVSNLLISPHPIPLLPPAISGHQWGSTREIGNGSEKTTRRAKNLGAVKLELVAMRQNMARKGYLQRGKNWPSLFRTILDLESCRFEENTISNNKKITIDFPMDVRSVESLLLRENIMKTNRLFALAIGAILLIGTIAGMTSASAQKTSNSSTAKLWLTAMDKDNDGTVSKEEFTAYMQAQFDKADVDHDGTLDKNELEQLRKNLGIAAKQ